MSRIGIFGGTFNPIHNGHIMLAEYCKSQAQLDKIIFIPTCTPPHKICKDLASETHRLNMCRLAVKNIDGFEVSDIEIRRKGRSYTYLTLEALKESYQNDNLFLIMGADMFLTLDEWKKPETIFKCAELIAVPRDESSFNDLKEYYNSVIKKSGARAVILPDFAVRISSTYIRENIKNSKKILPLIDRNVFEYIEKNNLYGV